MIPGVSFPESLASTELDTRASLDTEALQKVTETLPGAPASAPETGGAGEHTRSKKEKPKER